MLDFSGGFERGSVGGGSVMPVLDLECACGHRYEALRSVSTFDPDASRCPRCGSSELKVLPSHFLAVDKVRSTAEMSSDERSLHLENKAFLEANSEKILSGELGVADLSRCPVEFRPVCPEGLRRKWF